jgi:hypothetical protein
MLNEDLKKKEEDKLIREIEKKARKAARRSQRKDARKAYAEGRGPDPDAGKKEKAKKKREEKAALKSKGKDKELPPPPPPTPTPPIPPKTKKKQPTTFAKHHLKLPAILNQKLAHLLSLDKHMRLEKRYITELNIINNNGEILPDLKNKLKKRKNLSALIAATPGGDKNKLFLKAMEYLELNKAEKKLIKVIKKEKIRNDIITKKGLPPSPRSVFKFRVKAPVGFKSRSPNFLLNRLSLLMKPRRT